MPEVVQRGLRARSLLLLLLLLLVFCAGVMNLAVTMKRKRRTESTNAGLKGGEQGREGDVYAWHPEAEAAEQRSKCSSLRRSVDFQWVCRHSWVLLQTCMRTRMCVCVCVCLRPPPPHTHTHTHSLTLTLVCISHPTPPPPPLRRPQGPRQRS